MSRFSLGILLIGFLIAGTVFLLGDGLGPAAAARSGEVVTVAGAPHPEGFSMESTEGRREGLPEPNPSEAGFLPWPAVVRLLHGSRADRLGVLEANLPRPDLIPWLLERLEAGDIPRDRGHRPWVQLMRGVIEGWEQRDPAPGMSRREFLRRALIAGSTHPASGTIVFWTWKGQRYLDPSFEAIVESTREPLQAGGRQASQRYLVVLEDLLRSHLELGQAEPVLARLEDPLPRVRGLALRLLLEAGDPVAEGGLVRCFADLPSSDQRGVAKWIGEQLPPERAAAQLLLLQDNFRDQGLLSGGWQALAYREVQLVESALLLEIERSPGPSSGAARTLEAERAGYKSPIADEVRSTSMDQSYLISALSSAHLQGGRAASADGYLRVLDRAWNPLVRVQAWTALAGAPDAATRSLALSCLQEDRGGFLRDAGSFASSQIGESVEKLSRLLTDEELRLLSVELLPGLELSPVVRERILDLAAHRLD